MSFAKKHSRYEGSFDSKGWVLTRGWDPATPLANLIALAPSRSRGRRGAISFTHKDSVFCFVAVIFVFNTTSHAHAFPNHMNEHISGNSWSYVELVLVWIPKKGTIESIVAGVDASRDITIQGWAKSRNSSSEELRNESNDNAKKARRKKTKEKQADKTASSSARDEDHFETSRKKTLKRKHCASLSESKELTEDASPTKSPK